MKRLSILKALLVGLAALFALSGTARAAVGLEARWQQKAQGSGLSPLRRNAYAQLARLRVSRLSHPNDFGFDLMTITDGAHFPFKALYDMGLPALPVLAEV